MGDKAMQDIIKIRNELKELKNSIANLMSCVIKLNNRVIEILGDVFKNHDDRESNKYIPIEKRREIIENIFF